MRTIIFLVLIYLLYRLARDYVQGLGRRKQGPAPDAGLPESGEDTALDPVCRSYVPVESALRVRRGDEIHYFCSEECRKKFLASLKQ